MSGISTGRGHRCTCGMHRDRGEGARMRPATTVTIAVLMVAIVGAVIVQLAIS